MPRMHRPSAALDLFGAVPVTVPEIEAWTRAVAGIAPGTPRYDSYVRAWNVPDKVAAAKLDGSFERITAEACPCPHCRR